MIIIKSQDKSNIGNYDYVVLVDSPRGVKIRGFSNGDEVGTTLAKYNSKELAKEVMEEIENHIKYAYANKIQSNYKVQNYNELLDSSIYYMPKE